MSAVEKAWMKARESFKAAIVCFRTNNFDSCVSRCYYAMMWAAWVLLLANGYKFQNLKHGTLQRLFRVVALKVGLPDVLSDWMMDAYNLRRLADYNLEAVETVRAQLALSRLDAFLNYIGGVTSHE